VKTEHFICGLHAVTALLKNPHRNLRHLWINASREDERFQAVLKQAEEKKIPISRVSVDKLQTMFPRLTHQGMVAEATPLLEYGEKEIALLLSQCKQAPYILILDGVTDPHNLGACLRSADAAAIDFVIIPKDKSASITPVVSKVACGAVESVPILRVTNLVRAIRQLKAEGIWIFGAAEDAAEKLYECDLKIPCAFVLGAEGHGLRRLTREQCDIMFSLPMKGMVSSLNVSVATGICLFEGQRQRQV
jgi:23S rRNA (guanosine2251-2'-O)-methyltransferase